MGVIDNLLEALERCVGFPHCRKCPYAKGTGMMTCRELLMDVHEELKKRQWVQCSERMPDESGRYLVKYHKWSDGNYLPKFDDTYVTCMHYQATDRFTGWNYPRYIDADAQSDVHQEVIEWQPLPEV